MINEEQEIQEVVEELISDCNTYSENLNRLNEEGVQQLNEDLWEKIKYGLSKLGRYKAGGKIFRKGKIDKAAATQIKAIVDKRGNEVIQALDAKIKETNPKFPNNEKEEQFLNTILEISAVYDSIVASTQLKPEDKGFLPIDVANGVIEDLAAYVKKYLDVDLAAVYSTMDEEVDEAVVDKDFNITGKGSTSADAAKAGQKPDANAVRQQLQAKTGADATARDSQRMQTLKSNKLPLVLAGVGTALGALGWLAQTDWMSNLLQNIFGGNTPGVDAITQTIDGGAADPNGMVHWMSEINTAQGGGAVQNMGDVGEFINAHGAENVSHMFDGNGAGIGSMEQVQKLQEIVTSNPNASVGEIFKPDSPIFGDMKMGRNVFGISKAARFVSTVVVKQAVKAGVGAGVGVAASVAGVGAVLVPLGIGLIATGALVKAMRMKGQKQSRAKTLNDLFQSIQQLKGTAENPPVVDVTGEGPADDVKPEEKKPMSTDDLYNQLKKFFQFVKNNENVLGGGERRPTNVNRTKFPTTKTVTRDNVGKFIPPKTKNVAPLPEGVELAEGRYIQDKRTLEFLNKQSAFDKVKKFEEFLTRVETIRNIVRKMKNTGDKVLDGQVAKLRSNPIMTADFTKLFNAPSDNPQEVNSLKYFIDDMLKSLYSGQFKFMNIIDKIGTLGSKGNINKLEEAKGYNMDDPNKSFKKDALTKETFKKNLIPFVSELVNIFQYLDKKKNMASAPVKGEKPLKEEVERMLGLNEQIEKMKHLMRF